MVSIPPPGFGESPDLQPQPQPVEPAVVPPPAAPRPAGARAWRPWYGIAAAGIGIGITMFAGIFVVFGAAAFGASIDDPPPGVNIALTVVQNLALVGAALGLAWIAGRPRAGDFGLRAPRSFWGAVGLIVAVGIATYAFAFVWSVALGLDSEQELPKELGADGGLANQIAVAVLITVVAPLGEELFFRGFFYGSLRNWKGTWLAAVLTGLAFGLVHVGSAPLGFLAPLAFLGFLLCLLYERTGSLYPCIALHALNNAIALTIAMEWSGTVALALMAGALCASLSLAWLLGRALGDERSARLLPSPAPAG